MSTSKKGRTEGKQREQSKELRPERDAHRANKDPKKSKVVIVRDRQAENYKKGRTLIPAESQHGKQKSVNRHAAAAANDSNKNSDSSGLDLEKSVNLSEEEDEERSKNDKSSKESKKI